MRRNMGRLMKREIRRKMSLGSPKALRRRKRRKSQQRSPKISLPVQKLIMGQKKLLERNRQRRMLLQLT